MYVCMYVHQAREVLNRVSVNTVLETWEFGVYSITKYCVNKFWILRMRVCPSVRTLREVWKEIERVFLIRFGSARFLFPNPLPDPS